MEVKGKVGEQNLSIININVILIIINTVVSSEKRMIVVISIEVMNYDVHILIIVYNVANKKYFVFIQRDNVTKNYSIYVIFELFAMLIVFGGYTKLPVDRSREKCSCFQFRIPEEIFT